MSKDELNRLTEVLFSIFFQSKSTELLRNPKFWEMIKTICETYEIDAILVSKAARILLTSENIPSEKEMWYLLSKICSVREIKRLTGIYWQKQIKYQEEIENDSTFSVKPKIHDLAMRVSMRSFIDAVYDTLGVLDAIKLDDLHKLY